MKKIVIIGGGYLGNAIKQGLMESSTAGRAAGHPLPEPYEFLSYKWDETHIDMLSNMENLCGVVFVGFNALIMSSSLGEMLSYLENNKIPTVILTDNMDPKAVQCQLPFAYVLDLVKQSSYMYSILPFIESGVRPMFPKKVFSILRIGSLYGWWLPFLFMSIAVVAIVLKLIFPIPKALKENGTPFEGPVVCREGVAYHVNSGGFFGSDSETLLVDSNGSPLRCRKSK